MSTTIPVKKRTLKRMVERAMAAAENQFKVEWKETLDYFINQEKERSNSRRWYRLWIKPAPRFSFDEESVIKHVNARSYGMFDISPFISLEADLKNTKRWLGDYAQIAESHSAEEPIALAMKTFRRLDEPHRFIWVRAGGLFYTLERN